LICGPKIAGHYTTDFSQYLASCQAYTNKQYVKFTNISTLTFIGNCTRTHRCLLHGLEGMEILPYLTCLTITREVHEALAGPRTFRMHLLPRAPHSQPKPHTLLSLSRKLLTFANFQSSLARENGEIFIERKV